jgi:site-specific recombinase XerD
MASKTSSSHVRAPNSPLEATPDDGLIRGFKLSLGASGRAEKTVVTYEDAVRLLSGFARDQGMPGLAEMDTNVVRHWLMSLHKRGNKPGGISVRYRAVKRFFKWAVQEEERDANPMDRIDPPRIPNEIQPYYSEDNLNAVLKAIGRGKTDHEFRDKAIITTLYDTGMRTSELTGMNVEDIDWKDFSILVTGKGGKERRVSIGQKAAAAIDRYIRKRRDDSVYVWLASGNKSFSNNGLAMMLRRRFNAAGVPFRGAHAFRRAFAMTYLEGGGALDDLKELGGWEHYAMVTRYARANAGERAVKAHKRFSPGDRLNG